MFKIGLSGTRFSGKNEVASLFKKIGIPVFDVDLVIKFILAHEYEVLALIRDNVGSEYFIKGKLNTDKIEEDGVFDKILIIIEPIIFDAYNKFQTKYRKSIYTIFKSSILFDKGWHEKMDFNISVYSPFIHRVERAKESRERGFENLTKINLTLSKENDELKKNSFADYVIHNYNEFDLVNQVNKIDQKIIDYYLKVESVNEN